ncbi:septum formation initiator family protein [Alkalithermobacter paradoxus]|uniref:Cell division protein FtsL n=1 Tax=Alkalithermobacter paradoxus TaxID=29349 RepID=A0A1V4IAF5_9FIRM|nr:cell division protein FtsL [[Clostridium] thermoalcaliphilum]
MNNGEKIRSLQEYKNRKKNKIYREKNSKKKRKSINPIKIGLFIIVGIVLSLMCRYAIISTLKYEIHALNRELREIENKKRELHLNLERLSNSGYIEREAKKRLNMNYPDDEQIVYINVD